MDGNNSGHASQAAAAAQSAAQAAQPNRPEPSPGEFPITAVGSFLVVLCWLMLAIRVYVRVKMIKNWGSDDWAMVLATIFFTVYTAATIRGLIIVIVGARAHFDELARVWPMSGITNAATFIALKLSLGLFFLRFLVNKWTRRITYVMMAISTILNLVAALFYLISCGGPKNAAILGMTGNCMASPRMSFHDWASIAIYMPAYGNVVIDVIFCLLPIQMLVETTLDFRQKATVMALIVLSTAGSICGIARIFFIQTGGRQAKSYDPTYKRQTLYSYFSLIELSASIIGGCIATYRPLFSLFTQKVTTLGTGSRSRSRSRRTDPTELHDLESASSREPCRPTVQRGVVDDGVMMKGGGGDAVKRVYHHGGGGGGAGGGKNFAMVRTGDVVHDTSSTGEQSAKSEYDVVR